MVSGGCTQGAMMPWASVHPGFGKQPAGVPVKGHGSRRTPGVLPGNVELDVAIMSRNVLINK